MKKCPSCADGIQDAADISPQRHVVRLSSRLGVEEVKLIVLSALVVGLGVATIRADKIDPRLASVRKAFVEPVDELGDDRLVAVCLADHLKTTPPLSLVGSKDDAEVILRVRAHLTSGASRVLLGSMGGTPSANMEADLPDGTKLWADGAKYRRGNGAIGLANNARVWTGRRVDSVADRRHAEGARREEVGQRTPHRFRRPACLNETLTNDLRR
jgi:hypothetical protein